jgi:hypothetical protein
MSKDRSNPQESVLFPALFSLTPSWGKSVEASFTAPDLSSTGGLLLLRELEERIGFIDRMSNCLEDNRSPHLIRHSYKEMLLQRIFQIACGYEDADDCDLLRYDSLLKICTGRGVDSSALSSQPTVSRLENKPGIRELYDMGVFFVEEFIHSYAEEPECIILDCDDSNFNAYGNQQGTLFNNYYDEYCYMPLFIFEGISGKMILPLLRGGRRNKSANIFGILRRLITLMRRHWKKTRFIVRGDAHFCSREFMDWAAEKDYVDFVFGMVKNAVLSRQVEQWKQKAESGFAKNGEEVRMFRTFSYRAGSWKYPQKVVVKIEVNSCGTNVRYIVTGINHTSSRFLYESLYCGRGTMELYIKEMKNYLSSDRCSCSRFSANQFRFFLHAAAYVLLHGLKQEVFKGTSLYNVSILTLQQKVLPGAVHIRSMKTKIKIEFSDKHPYRNELALAFCRFRLWSGAA